MQLQVGAAIKSLQSVAFHESETNVALLWESESRDVPVEPPDKVW